ncbi:MAG: FAD-dependent oxidoreductase [Verrucomicrobia bacterium]|nr:FAD-dependent oxidoreductase [Verrucomicrobiota bacterium]
MASPVKIKASVSEVVRHTGSVASYHFKPQGRVPKFHAGQFLHLALDEYQPNEQWPESRVFSIASAPSERHEELAVTISVKGRFTERIFQTLENGSECWLKLPYGEFLFPPDKHLILIAGGVGITPYLSLLKQMLEEKSEQAVMLYYGIRSAEHYLFGDLIKRCEAELPNFGKAVYCEDGSAPGEKGVLNIVAIHAAAPSGSLFYLSGPPAMIGTFRKRLQDLGVEAERVRVDDWE